MEVTAYVVSLEYGSLFESNFIWVGVGNLLAVVVTPVVDPTFVDCYDGSTLFLGSGKPASTWLLEVWGWT